MDHTDGFRSFQAVFMPFRLSSSSLLLHRFLWFFGSLSRISVRERSEFRRLGVHHEQGGGSGLGRVVGLEVRSKTDGANEDGGTRRAPDQLIRDPTPIIARLEAIGSGCRLKLWL